MSDLEQLFAECVAVQEVEEAKPQATCMIMVDSMIITTEMRRTIEMNAYRRRLPLQ